MGLLSDGAIVETSGSTGRPKRVRLSGAAFRASAKAAADELGAPGRWVLALPDHYVAGLNVIARAEYWGQEPVSAIGGPRFSALGFAAVTAGLDGPLYTSLVPVLLSRLLDSAPGCDALRRFDRVLLGGQAPDPALLARARQEGIRVTVTYGMTETCGGVVWDGRPIGDTEVMIRDGVIHIAGSTLADEYIGEPELTAEAFPVVDGRRWHRTKDRGELSGGTLTVLGRTDDTIISGGVKVSLTSVEFAARELGFADAVAVASPRGAWGEGPVIVTAAPRDDPADARVSEHIKASLGPAAAPVVILHIGRMPLLASGKPDRIALAALVQSAGSDSSRP